MIERKAQDEKMGGGGGKFSVFKSSKSLAYLLARKEIKKIVWNFSVLWFNNFQSLN